MPPLRSLRVALPGQSRNAIKHSWPSIGCWFWTTKELAGDGYRAFLDKAEQHSAFGLLTTSLRAPVEVTDPAVHDQLKRAALYAQTKGIGLVLDLDVRLARQAFREQYPSELQELVRLRTTSLRPSGEVELAVALAGSGDHYTFKARGYDVLSSRLLRAYSYRATPDGPAEIRDITARCTVRQADTQAVRVALSCDTTDTGRTLCVLAAQTVFTPDVFAPHLLAFERKTLEQYADLPLAGVCKDEWGFPGGVADPQNLWYSEAFAHAYAQRRPGHTLVRDLLLMSLGEQGRESERTAAIQHYQALSFERNAEVEAAFYKSVKKVFGRTVLVATHPTWFPFPNRLEVFKNGLDWWACPRDLAQTDEATPFCVRTALAKKWHSPLWFNMYYDSNLVSYEQDLWRHVLGGGRMNFHPLYPGPWETEPWALARSRVLQAEARLSLLNLIATAPVDCPVAVVFGHQAALDWSGKGFAEVGLEVTNALWAAGFYADLIPSSELVGKHLTVARDGSLQYGPQRYAAVVRFSCETEPPEVAALFRAVAAHGKTRVFEAAAGVEPVLAHLRTLGLTPQTPGTLHSVAGFPPSVMPQPRGQCRFLDGTVLVASGEHDVLGDPLPPSFVVAGQSVQVDAVGFAAVRLGKSQQLEALAAGGLKHLSVGAFSLTLPERTDLALWRDPRGAWQGALFNETIPEILSKRTAHWTCLRLPRTLTGETR